MNWLRNFMVGRYGLDQMNIGMLVFSMICTFVASFGRGRLFVLSLLGILALVYGIFRMFSRNTQARAKENEAFLRIWNVVKGWFARLRKWFDAKKIRFQNRKTHCYFSCPTCKKQMRVPRGKGKIEITCPMCGTKFVKKT